MYLVGNGIVHPVGKSSKNHSELNRELNIRHIREGRKQMADTVAIYEKYKWLINFEIICEISASFFWFDENVAACSLLHAVWRMHDLIARILT